MFGISKTSILLGAVLGLLIAAGLAARIIPAHSETIDTERVARFWHKPAGPINQKKISRAIELFGEIQSLEVDRDVALDEGRQAEYERLDIGAYVAHRSLFCSYQKLNENETREFFKRLGPKKASDFLGEGGVSDLEALNTNLSPRDAFQIALLYAYTDMQYWKDYQIDIGHAQREKERELQDRSLLCRR